MNCLKTRFTVMLSILLAPIAAAQSGPPEPARISVQPVDVTRRVGEIARFSIEATGTGPIAYVWLKNGNPIPSSDGPEWAVPVAAASDDGARFRCVVANGSGSDTSLAATLHVSTALIAPRILVQPDSAPVAVGDTGYFKVSARGTAPLAFTWLKGGTLIPGATDSILKLFPIAWTDNGSVLQCRISNAAGTAESNPFSLRVVQPNGKTIVLQGELSDALGVSLGKDREETVDVIVRLYREAKGGLPLYEEAFREEQGNGVAVRQGRFSVALGQSASTGDLSAVVQGAPALFVSFAVAEPGLTPETLEPRTPFTSAPYALSAPPARLKGDSAPAAGLEAPLGTIYEIKSSGARYVRSGSGWTRITP
jgi:hypothetical protein